MIDAISQGYPLWVADDADESNVGPVVGWILSDDLERVIPMVPGWLWGTVYASIEEGTKYYYGLTREEAITLRRRGQQND